MKIVVNRSFGVFSLSEAVFNELGIEGGPHDYYLHNEDFGIKSDNPKAYRADSRLIAAIEKIGLEKSVKYRGETVLKIIDIPDDVEWEINDWNGFETICEKHREW